ncbi:MAG: outer membrane protein assembly factor BamB [Paracoccaceae bacterium]|jgi:outer membrane protein assembly factor BamB
MNTVFSPFHTRPGRAGLVLLGALSLVLLNACAEPERILPGKREDVRTLPDGSAIAAVENTSRAISLPGQSSNASWTQSIGTPAYRPAHPALRAAPQRIWSTPIGAGNDRKQRITADPVVGGGLIYTLDSGARVSGVTPAGAVAWSADLIPNGEGDDEATGGGMAYVDGVLYVSTGFGRLTALTAKTGATRWQQKLDATGSGAPMVSGNLLYLVAGDDTGWAIDTKTGRIAWQIDATPSQTNVLGAPAPALAGDLVVFAFGSGDVITTFKRGGLRRWSASVAGRRPGLSRTKIGDITGSPVVVGRTVYVGNHSGRTAAFSIDTGDRLWTANEGALGPVWPVGGSLFLVSETGNLVRLNASDGSVIWAVKLPGNIKDKPRKRGPSYAQYGPVLAGGRVVVPSGDGKIRFFSPQDGSLISTVDIPGGATSGPVVAGSTLYVMGAKGELHAFR